MHRILMNTLRGIPKYSCIFKKIDDFVLLFCAMVLLSGCITSNYSTPLAPSPPDMAISYSFYPIYGDYNLYEPSDSSEQLSALISNGIVRDVHSVDSRVLTVEEVQNNSLKKCRLKDRFDRKAVLAYEWDRSRLSVDVDGVNLSGGDDYGVRLEYRLRFQPEKPVQELCRYPSSWQGMIGSGYNEFFVKEDGQVMEEIKAEIRGFRQHFSFVTDRLF